MVRGQRGRGAGGGATVKGARAWRQNVSRTVQQSVRKPVQQIAGIIAGVKKAVETWVDRSPFKRPMTAEEGYRPYEPPRQSATGYTTTVVETETVESKRTTPYG